MHLLFNRKKERGLSTMSNKSPLQSVWNRDVGQFLFFDTVGGFFGGGGDSQGYPFRIYLTHNNLRNCLLSI